MWLWFHTERATSTATYGVPTLSDRIWWVRTDEPAAAVKKAKGASWTALRIPISPDDTGSEAWSQMESVLLRLELRMLLGMLRSC